MEQRQKATGALAVSMTTREGRWGGRHAWVLCFFKTHLKRDAAEIPGAQPQTSARSSRFPHDKHVHSCSGCSPLLPVP